MRRIGCQGAGNLRNTVYGETLAKGVGADEEVFSADAQEGGATGRGKARRAISRAVSRVGDTK